MRLIHKGYVTPAHLVHMDINKATMRLKKGKILTDIDADLVQLMWGMTTDAEVRVCVCVWTLCMSCKHVHEFIHTQLATPLF